MSSRPHAALALQILEQRQNLRLHRHVESGGRFVGDQHLRLAGQHHGNQRPLTLAAG
jgi:hypothetical protein